MGGQQGTLMGHVINFLIVALIVLGALFLDSYVGASQVLNPGSGS